MAKKAYIGVPRALPNGYTQVEYIQSSGTQYIDTGVFLNNNSKVVADCEITYSTGWAMFLGSYGSSDRFSWWTNDAKISPYYGATGKNADGVTGRTTLIADKNKWSDGVSEFSFPETSFVAAHSMYLFSVNNGGNYRKAPLKLYSCQVYDNGTLVRDFVPCTDSSGTAGLYDMANGVFYQNAGTGTFAVGANVVSVARKIKKGYVGVDGKARQIKKAYIGIGGVARPCWSGGELAYYGTITDLSVARTNLSASSVGDYALFAGGEVNGSPQNVVDAYSASLTRTSATILSQYRYNIAATSTEKHAMFGGGYLGDYNSPFHVSTVDAYDKSLTRGTASLTQTRYDAAGASIGDYALFAGGQRGSVVLTDVDAINSSLTRTAATALQMKRCCLAGSRVGNHALFAGGSVYYHESSHAHVDAYDSSLTRTSATTLSVARQKLAATTVGNYALFGGGANKDNTNPQGYTNVDAYNSSLTRTALDGLGNGVQDLAATTVEDFALFGGGRVAQTSSYATVTVYDASLTRTFATDLSVKCFGHAAATVGNYALFGGGYNNSGNIKTVNAYVVA